MNIVFAVVLATVIYFVGLPEMITPPVVGNLSKESTEYALGIREGDIVTKIDDHTSLLEVAQLPPELRDQLQQAAFVAVPFDLDVLLAPRTERPTPEFEVSLANAIAGRAAVTLLDMADPDALSDHLYAAEAGTPVATPALPIGTRRQVTRVAATALRPDAPVIDLPEHAPYGAVLVDTDACTLCLSCVSLCPSGALADNEDKPQLLFQEDACLQCGLCANICPEDAITLEPRLNLQPEAMRQEVLNEEEPFACIDCGKLFGVKSTIEAVTEKLANHSMYANPIALRMIQMCDTCRINAQYHSENNPFAAGSPRRPRTTDDYLSESPSKRRDH